MAASAEAVQPARLKGKWWFLPLGFGLTFIHLFWYGHPSTAWLALICYAPFLAFLYDRSKRPFLAGFTFGIWYGVMNMYWLAQFVGKWTNSWFVGGLATLAVGAIWGAFYGSAAWLTVKLIKGKVANSTAEVQPSRLQRFFSTDPNGSKLGLSLSDLSVVLGLSGILFLIADRLRQVIPEFQFPFCNIGEPLVVYGNFGGLSNVSAATLLINSWFAILLITPTIKSTQRTFSFIIVSFGLVKLCFENLFTGLGKSEVNLKIGLGQLGFDLAYADPQMAPFLVRDAADKLIEKARNEKVDLLIFPEAVAQFADQPATPFRLPDDFQVMFGATRGTGPRYQSAYLWSEGKFQFTDKNNLVVFGEYVPFRNIIPYPSSFQLPSGDLKAGTERRPLRLKNGKTVGPMICFESLFSESATDFKRQNADFLAIMSLDDWYMGTSAIPRLEIAARWRAVETRKWVVRVGSLGKTMVINPRGEVVKELPIGSQELLVAEF